MNIETVSDLLNYIETEEKAYELIKYIASLEKYKYAYESIIKSLKGNIEFLKRNQLSQDRIGEDEYVIKTLKWYFNNYNKEG